MKFAYIPKADYHIGQILTVQGQQLQIESYSHTGKNVVAHTLPDAVRFERVVCVVTDAEPITEKSWIAN